MNSIVEKKRGFRPSDLFDHSKRQILFNLSKQLWPNKNVLHLLLKISTSFTTEYFTWCINTF